MAFKQPTDICDSNSIDLMLKLLEIGLSVRHQVHDRSRVEDILPVERPHNGPAVLAAAATRLQTKLVGVQELRPVQAEDHLKTLEVNRIKE